jgi:uncharacterized Zn-binding protein involved in type VI secretion
MTAFDFIKELEPSEASRVSHVNKEQIHGQKSMASVMKKSAGDNYIGTNSNATNYHTNGIANDRASDQLGTRQTSHTDWVYAHGQSNMVVNTKRSADNDYTHTNGNGTTHTNGVVDDRDSNQFGIRRAARTGSPHLYPTHPESAL